jgi:Flp pilus assembly protein TadD
MSKKSKAHRRNDGGPGKTKSSSPEAVSPAGTAGSSGKSSLRARIAGIAVVVVVAIVGVAIWTLRGEAPPAAPAAPATASLAEPHYVGGAQCASCHVQEHAAWQHSDHDLAMASAGEKSVLGNFANARFSYAGITSTFSRRDGKFYVNTDGPDGKLADYEIKYTFGVHPLQQYLIELPGGRKQALSIAWDSRAKSAGGQRWFHLYPGQNIKAGDPLHWTGVGQNWNFQCAECHSTNLRKNYDAKAETFNTTWAEINVSCEACHGPGSNHLAWANRQGDWQLHSSSKGLALALDERKGAAWTPVAATGNARRSVPRTTSREIDTCVRCHGRSSRINDDYVHGKPPLDTHRLAVLDDPFYWNDGQMRGEVYIWGSFAQSKMHAQGVTCSDCHEPHSLKLKAAGNAVCAQCHQPAKYDAVAHTHHQVGTPGAACTACHMPTTTYMQVDPRHDHSMRIPRPDLSVKVGAPNACNDCHTTRNAQWSADTIRRWTGRAPASFQNFAAVLHAGSVGAPGARDALLGVIADAAQPSIVRASALERLGGWLTPGTLAAVTRALNDPEPIVRLAAVEALAGADAATRTRYVPGLLEDPVRTVRIESARAISDIPASRLTERQQRAFDKALAEYVAVQTYNADRPDAHVNLGNLRAQRGDPDLAIAEFRKALALDPTFVAAYANLADLHRARNADRYAEAVLREGLARNPRAAILHHALGLALVRSKQVPESLRELGEAAKLEPDNARFAYVLAVALNGSGQNRTALGVLDAALKKHPYDRDLLSALAHFQLQSGNRALALTYAKQLRELDPENDEYVQIVKQIDASR